MDSQQQEATAESRASRTARGQRRVDCCCEAAALRETPETAASVRKIRTSDSGCSVTGADEEEEGGLRLRSQPLPRRAIGTSGVRLAPVGKDGEVQGGSGAGKCMALGGGGVRWERR